MTKKRVVITGIGTMTACGKGWNPYWEAVLESQSSIREIEGFPSNGQPAKLGGQINDFSPSDYVQPRKALKLMSREIQLAIAASRLAVEDANVSLDDADRDRFGISLGTGMINIDLEEISQASQNSMNEGQFDMTRFGQEGIRSLYPLWLLKYLPNMPACHIAIAHGLRGPNNSITTSSAASAQAIGEAYRMIERGDADLMLAGGADSKIEALGLARFGHLGLLSTSFDSAQAAYRPFDEKHNGMLLGEGAGLMVLESYDHAVARGAKIYGEVVGFNSSSDFHHDLSDPQDFTGKRLAMLRAMEDAELSPEDIDFVLANGSGVPVEDIQEATALKSVFNDSMTDLHITAIKPITGHLFHGAGGVEIAVGALSLHHGKIPPVTHLDNPAPKCDLPFVKSAPVDCEPKAFLFNSFGFGGQNACLVIKKA